MKNITIVGGGLVGSLLAVLMAKRGHKVDVYERRSDPRAAEQYAGRSINLVVSHRGWTALRAAGIDERIREITVPVYARMTHDPQGKTNRLPYSIENKAIYSVSRGELNNRLLSEAERMPGVTLHFGYRCDDVDLDKASCTFARKGEEPKTVKADVVLACDGAFSAVRAKMQYGRFNYSQEYIEHDYKEIAFPAGPDGNPLMDPQCLHIWPRRYYMLMGLANQDGGFTGTLFMPHNAGPEAPDAGFDKVRTEAEADRFLKTHFPDAYAIIPDMTQQYMRHPQSTLVIVRCSPWTHGSTAALFGDAAHAMVPFYGEGMNAGYEDCKVLNDLLDEHGDDNWGAVLNAYDKHRVANGHAIADLSLRNFTEMRDLVADPRFILRKKIEGHIQAKHPDLWLPLYTQVKFTDIPYVDALREGQRHDRIMEEILAMPGIETKWESEEVERKALGLLKKA
ncbi:MAG: NAD(P)/FAD-dependent oxidoreductase [Flavobacteriales bacterium]|jgi:kynurenine 3-monooxygenase